MLLFTSQVSNIILKTVSLLPGLTKKNQQQIHETSYLVIISLTKAKLKHKSNVWKNYKADPIQQIWIINPFSDPVSITL